MITNKSGGRLVQQTPVGDRVVVVTVKEGRKYLTEVLGGVLDGWPVWSDTYVESRETHDDVVSMVQSTVGGDT